MLFAAGHAKNDIPSVLSTYEVRYPEMEIRYGRELGIDPKMMHAAADRIQTALDQADQAIDKHETLLMVVGRGASIRMPIPISVKSPACFGKGLDLVG